MFRTPFFIYLHTCIQILLPAILIFFNFWSANRHVTCGKIGSSFVSYGQQVWSAAVQTICSTVSRSPTYDLTRGQTLVSACEARHDYWELRFPGIIQYCAGIQPAALGWCGEHPTLGRAAPSFPVGKGSISWQRLLKWGWAALGTSGS